MVNNYFNEDELLDKKHFPVYIVLNGAPDFFFPEEMRCLSMGVGFGNDAGDCSFWDDLDAEDQEKYGKFDGAIFSSWFLPQSAILNCTEILYYARLACKKYCEKHPKEEKRMGDYLKAFAKLKGLE